MPRIERIGPALVARLVATVPGAEEGSSAFYTGEQPMGNGPPPEVVQGPVDRCAYFVEMRAGTPSGGDGQRTDPSDGGPFVVRSTLLAQVVARGPQRSAPSAYQRGLDSAWACYKSLSHFRDLANGICIVRPNTGGPEPFPINSDHHHRWVMPMTVRFEQTGRPVYWGIGVDVGPFDEAFVKALTASDAPRSGQQKSVTHVRKFQALSGVATFIYYSIPQEITAGETPTFQVGTLAGGFSVVATPTVDGVVHDLWRSDFAGIGQSSVEVF